VHGREVFVVDAVRTPVGRLGGALADTRPDDLGAVVIKALLERTPTLDPGHVGEVYFGAANQSGEDNRNVARMSALLAGLPTSVPGSTLNRLCASGLDALVAATRAIAVGDASIMVAGGLESMTRAPWVLPKSNRPFPVGNAQMYSTTLGWRMVNPQMPDGWTASLGECTEMLGEKYGITREAADEFSARSQTLAAKAWADGAYDSAVVQVPNAEMTRDEGIRDGCRCRGPAAVRHRSGPCRTTVAGESRQDTPGRDRDGAQRSLRCAVPGLPVRVEGARPRPGQPARRGDRHRAPVGLLCARLAGAVAHQLAAAGSGVGVAALCIGVGQGLAVTMER